MLPGLGFIVHPRGHWKGVVAVPLVPVLAHDGGGLYSATHNTVEMLSNSFKLTVALAPVPFVYTGMLALDVELSLTEHSQR